MNSNSNYGFGSASTRSSRSSRSNRSNRTISTPRSAASSVNRNVAFNAILHEMNEYLQSASSRSSRSSRSSLNKHFKAAEEAVQNIKNQIKTARAQLNAATTPRAIASAERKIAKIHNINLGERIRGIAGKVVRNSPGAKISPRQRMNYIRGVLRMFGTLKNSATNEQLKNTYAALKTIRPGGVLPKVFTSPDSAYSKIKAARHRPFRNPAPRNVLRVSPARRATRALPLPVPRVRVRRVNRRTSKPYPKLNLTYTQLYERPEAIPNRPIRLFNQEGNNRFYNYIKGKNLASVSIKNLLSNLGNTPRVRNLISRTAEQFRWNQTYGKRKIQRVPMKLNETRENVYRKRLASAKPRRYEKTEKPTVYVKKAGESGYLPKGRVPANIMSYRPFTGAVPRAKRVELEGGPSYARKPEAWEIAQQALGNKVRVMPNFEVQLQKNEGGKEFFVNDAGVKHQIVPNVRLPPDEAKYKLKRHVYDPKTKKYVERVTEHRIKVRRFQTKTRAQKRVTAAGLAPARALLSYNDSTFFGVTTHKRAEDIKKIYITPAGIFRTATRGGAPILDKHVPAALVKLVSDWKDLPKPKPSVYEYLTNKNYHVPN